jgi:RHS repeat-associated protein
LKNNYLYQGAFAELDDDIGWTDFALRNYDAQIGRFIQQDPFQQFASPYVGMGDDPINLTDPSGGSVVIPGGGGSILSMTAETAKTLGGVVVKSSGHALKVVEKTVTAVSKVSIAIRTANLAVRVINISVNTNQVGRQIGGGEEPKVSISGGSIYKSGKYVLGGEEYDTRGLPIIFKPRIKITGAKGSGLQIIQFAYGTYTDKQSSTVKTQWQKSKLLDKAGKPLSFTTAFIDNQASGGGWESEKEKTAVPGKPYYYEVGRSLGKGEDDGNGTWDGENGEITAYDVPGAVDNFDNLKFETYIVVTDYNGEKGLDRIVGVIKWGFTKVGRSGTITPDASGNTATITPTNWFSDIATQLMLDRYANYFTHDFLKGLRKAFIY